MISRLAGAFALAALTAAAQTGGSVQGRVVSSVHAEPVANARVIFRLMPPAGGAARNVPEIYVCQTRADGRYSIPNIPPGDYDARASKLGFESRPSNTVASASEYPPITIHAGQAVTNVDLRMIPDSVIAGKVVDADGDPVRYAQVETLEWMYANGKRQLIPRQVVQTNDRGEYRIFRLAPGRYYLRAESGPRSRPIDPGRGQVRGTLPPAGLAATFYPNAAEASGATELEAAPGGELNGIDFRLAPQRRYSIKGALLGAGAQSRRAVRLVERSGNLVRPQYIVQTRPDGYEIRNVPPGSYVVIGESTETDKPQVREFARQEVDVVDRDIPGVDLSFSPGVDVRGTVKVDGAAPSGNMTLLFQGNELGSQQQAKVAPDGKFEVTGLPPGVHQLRIIGGQGAYLKSIRAGDRELPDLKIDTQHLAGEVTVVVGTDFSQLQGTVTDDDGKPVYGALVTLIPDQGKPDWQDRFRTVVTTAGGKYRLNGVVPGEYRAFAWTGTEPGAPQSADFRKPYEERGVAIKAEPNKMQTQELKAIKPAIRPR